MGSREEGRRGEERLCQAHLLLEVAFDALEVVVSVNVSVELEPRRGYIQNKIFHCISIFNIWSSCDCTNVPDGSGRILNLLLSKIGILLFFCVAKTWTSFP